MHTVEATFATLTWQRSIPPCAADLFLFNLLSAASSGFLDGLNPANVNEPYPAIQAVRKTVATLPAVSAWYDEQATLPYMQKMIGGKTIAELYKPFYTARDLEGCFVVGN